MQLRAAARRDVIRFVDSYASLLVLLLANFFLLELVDDPRGGRSAARCSRRPRSSWRSATPRPGHHLKRRHVIQIGACVALAPLVLFVNST